MHAFYPSCLLLCYHCHDNRGVLTIIAPVVISESEDDDFEEQEGTKS